MVRSVPRPRLNSILRQTLWALSLGLWSVLLLALAWAQTFASVQAMQWERVVGFAWVQSSVLQAQAA